MTRKKQAVNAILEEYRKVIFDLQNVVSKITSDQLISIMDPHTSNPDCRSIQTILSHVVSSGYSYAVYIRNHRNQNSVRPAKLLRFTNNEYIKDLDGVIEFTYATFSGIYDDELEEFETSNKMKTGWGQSY